MRHFSHLIGGSEVGRSQNGSIDSGVFRDSRADCAKSYRFVTVFRVNLAVPNYRIYRSEFLAISRSEFATNFVFRKSDFLSAKYLCN